MKPVNETPSSPSSSLPVKLRAGLIGAGQICKYHIAALRRLSFVEIVGVHDVDAARAQAFAREMEIPFHTSLDALVKAGANVIHVLTPPHTHAAIALAALDAGCHVYVEKPLAVDVADCRAIENLAGNRGLKVCVGHSLLYDPQVRRALETVRSGKIGRVVSVDFLRSSLYPPYAGGSLPPHMRSAGYPFRDIGVHALYVFEAFLGPIEHVQADYKSLGGAPNLAFDEWRAQVRCRDGIAQCQLSWNTRPLQSQLIIQGTKGVLRVDLFLMFQSRRGALPIPKPAERVINAITDNVRPLIDVPIGVLGFLTKRIRPYHGLQALVGAFYESLRDGSASPVTVSDAKRVVQWTERIARTADQEHRRRVAEFRAEGSVPFLVTGASGAVGRAIVARLRDEGHTVRALVRRVPDSPPVDGVQTVIGDLGDPEAVDRAVRGAKVVIHAGAAMRGWWEDFQCATLNGTKNVIESCLAHGVKKVVHVSSLSVVDWASGHKNDGDPIRETSTLEPHAEMRGHYTRSKLEAEQMIVRAARERALPAIVLRPGQIFGGGIPILTPAVARKAGKRWIVLGNGRQRLPLVHMDDVVEAIIRAASDETTASRGEIVHIVGDACPTQNETLDTVLGQDARVVHVPRFIVLTLGATITLMLRMLGRSSPVSVYRLRSAMARRKFTSEHRKLLHGWRPRIGLRGEPGRSERELGGDDIERSAATSDELLAIAATTNGRA